MSSFPGLQDYFEEDDVMFEAIPWAILKTDKLAGYMAQVSVIGHKCDEFDIVQFLDEEDAIGGVCWWCKTVIPDEVQGLWKMLNWENIPNMRVYDSDELEATSAPHTRFKKTTTQVGQATQQTQKIRSKKNQTNVFHPSKDKTQTVVGRHTAP